MVTILSSDENSPKYSPLLSTFSLFTELSYHIFLACRVDIPDSFRSTLLTDFLVTIFPIYDLPFIEIFEKSISNFKFFMFLIALK